MITIHTHPEDYKNTGAIVNGEFVASMSFGGGSKPPNETTTKIDLPGNVRALLPEITQGAQQRFEAGGPQVFTGQRAAELDPFQLQALQAIGQQGLAPSGIQGAAEQQLIGTLGGQGFGGGFDQALEAASRGLTTQFQEATLPGIRSAFVNAGRTGRSGLLEGAEATAQQSLATGLGDLSARFANDERDRQIRALSLSPRIEQSGFFPLQQALNAGGQLQQQDQLQLAVAQEQFEEEQNAPDIALNDLINRFGAAAAPFAGQVTEIGPRLDKTNKALTFVGGAAAGATTGAAIGAAGGPIGATGGAIIGGLAGLFA